MMPEAVVDSNQFEGQKDFAHQRIVSEVPAQASSNLYAELRARIFLHRELFIPFAREILFELLGKSNVIYRYEHVCARNSSLNSSAVGELSVSAKLMNPQRAVLSWIQDTCNLVLRKKKARTCFL